jgi:dihydroxyacetone kinase
VSEKFTTRRTGIEQVAETVTEEASEESLAAAAVARKAVDAIYATIEENKEYLGQIDAIAATVDHGIGMSRGSKAAAEAAE